MRHKLTTRFSVTKRVRPEGESDNLVGARPTDSTGQSLEAAALLTLRQRGAKRLIDLAGGLALLVALSPVFGVICILIKLASPGPIFYRRSVLGLNGKSFTVLKFRSMIPDAHAKLFSDPALLREYRENLKIARD